jgi:mannose-6-phosphate isomerase-like protein (cupin superfamily)
MSWGRISHPSEMLKVGQEIDVVVLDINREKERVSLGLKQKTPNPWDSIEQKYPVGARVKGRVVNLVPYGAFVELEPGVEGLVHVTELSWTKRIAKPSDVLKQGEEIGSEVHPNVDQFFRFEMGEGKVIIAGQEFAVKDGSAVVVPAGNEHNVINTGNDPLKLYTIYSPPNHPDGTIHKTKQEAEAYEAQHHH